jgi:hypothetical protein
MGLFFAVEGIGGLVGMFFFHVRPLRILVQPLILSRASNKRRAARAGLHVVEAGLVQRGESLSSAFFIYLQNALAYGPAGFRVLPCLNRGCPA